LTASAIPTTNALCAAIYVSSIHICVTTKAAGTLEEMLSTMTYQSTCRTHAEQVLEVQAGLLTSSPPKPDGYRWRFLR
jgi:hypothetical protein